MEQTIKAIIVKANQEGCIKGYYIIHSNNPELFSVNVELDTGSIILVPVELIEDYSRNANISVCNRIKIIKR